MKRALIAVVAVAALVCPAAASAAPFTVFGPFGTGAGSNPESVAVDSNGNAYVVNAGPSPQTITEFNASGSPVNTFGGPQFTNHSVEDIKISPDGTKVFVATTDNGTGGAHLFEFNPSGGGFKDHQVTGSGSYGTGLAVDPTNPNSIFFGDSTQGKVFRSTDGANTWLPLVNGYPGVDGIALLGGKIFIAVGTSVIVMNPDGTYPVTNPVPGANSIRGLAPDGSGGLVVNDYVKPAVDDCTISPWSCTQVGGFSPGLTNPGFPGTDCRNNVYIPDHGNNVVYVGGMAPRTNPPCPPPLVFPTFNGLILTPTPSTDPVMRFDGKTGDWIVEGRWIYASPSATQPSSPTPFSLQLTAPFVGFSLTGPGVTAGPGAGAFTIPAINPGTTAAFDGTFTVHDPLAPDTFDTLIPQFQLNGAPVAVPSIFLNSPIATFLPLSGRSGTGLTFRAVVGAAATRKRATTPKRLRGFAGTVETALPPNDRNPLAAGTPDPNEVVRVQIALVQPQRRATIVESAAAQPTTAKPKPRAKVRCLDYLRGGRTRPERVSGTTCTGLVWLDAKMTPGTNKWAFAFDPKHPLPAGTWIAYARAITRAGAGDPQIKDTGKPEPYRRVFTCKPKAC